MIPISTAEGRLNKRTQQVMYKANTWISYEELDAINKMKGDITISLFIKRLIREAISKKEQKNTPLGGQFANQHPQTAAIEAVKTTPTTDEKNTTEAEVV